MLTYLKTVVSLIHLLKRPKLQIGYYCMRASLAKLEATVLYSETLNSKKVTKQPTGHQHLRMWMQELTMPLKSQQIIWNMTAPMALSLATRQAAPSLAQELRYCQTVLIFWIRMVLSWRRLVRLQSSEIPIKLIFI